MGRRGPAPKGAYHGKTNVLSTRIRPDTRSALVAAAKRSGRSLSNEIEHRLRRSFDDDQKMSEIFGNRQVYAVMRLIAAVLEAKHVPLGSRPWVADWMSDPVKIDRMILAVTNVLEALKPEASPDDEHGWTHATNKIAGELVSEPVLRSVAKAPDAIPAAAGSRDLSVIKSDLGAGAAARIAAAADRLAARYKPTRKGKGDDR